MNEVQLNSILSSASVSKSALQQALRIECFATYAEIATLTASNARTVWMRVNRPSASHVRAFEDRRDVDGLGSSESTRAKFIAHHLLAGEPVTASQVLDDARYQVAANVYPKANVK
jgi:hypothetical protein